MTRSLTGSHPDTRREHHLAAPRVCELPPRQRPRRLLPPSLPRPRTCSSNSSTLSESAPWTLDNPCKSPDCSPDRAPSPVSANATVSTLWLFPDFESMLWAIVLSFPYACATDNFTPPFWMYMTVSAVMFTLPRRITARLYRNGQRAPLTVATAQDCTCNPGQVLTQLPETDQYQASTCRRLPESSPAMLDTRPSQPMPVFPRAWSLGIRN